MVADRHVQVGVRALSRGYAINGMYGDSLRFALMLDERQAASQGRFTTAASYFKEAICEQARRRWVNINSDTHLMSASINI